MAMPYLMCVTALLLPGGTSCSPPATSVTLHTALICPPLVPLISRGWPCPCGSQPPPSKPWMTTPCLTHVCLPHFPQTTWDSSPSAPCVTTPCHTSVPPLLSSVPAGPCGWPRLHSRPLGPGHCPGNLILHRPVGVRPCWAALVRCSADVLHDLQAAAGQAAWVSRCYSSEKGRWNPTVIATATEFETAVAAGGKCEWQLQRRCDDRLGMLSCVLQSAGLTLFTLPPVHAGGSQLGATQGDIAYGTGHKSVLHSGHRG